MTNQTDTKTCTECGETKPTSEFHKGANYRGGLRSRCKTCQAAYRAIYHTVHRRKTTLNTIAWRKANPDRYRAQRHHRRATKRGAEGSYTADDIRRIRDAQGGRCCYCGAEAELTVDHIVPLSRGGTNWVSNITLSCLTCNSSKGNKLMREWFQTVGNPTLSFSRWGWGNM